MSDANATARPHRLWRGKRQTRNSARDDNNIVRVTLSAILEQGGFTVLIASEVNEALKLIGSHTFDVLLSDLHMPGAGDGLTVVSAMRHCNPKAVTIIFSGYPEMKEAAAAILLRADEILVKPVAPAVLIERIKAKLKLGPSTAARTTQTVAYILERETQQAIKDWLLRVESIEDVITVPLSAAQRCARLPQLFQDLITRLQAPLALGTRAHASAAAARHGAAPPGTGIHRDHDRRGIARAAGQHSSGPPKQSASCGLQPAPAGGNGDRRRSRFAAGASHGELCRRTAEEFSAR